MLATKGASTFRRRVTGVQELMTWENRIKFYPYMGSGGFEPHPHQRAVLKDRSRFKVLCCGRRWGKSLLAASEAIICALMGGWVWIVAPTNELANVIYELAVVKVMESPFMREFLDAEPRMAQGQQRMTFKTGGRIYAKQSGRPESLLGVGIDLIIFDEASKEKNSTIVPQYLRPTLSDRDGSMMLISTPTGMDWFYDEWLRGQTGVRGYKSWQHPSTSNPWLPGHEVEYQKGQLPEDIFQQEYLAQFNEYSGGIFRRVSECAFGEIIYEPKFAGTRYVMGVDLAKIADFTVITIIDAVTKRVVYMERFNQLDWAIQKARIIELSRVWNASVMVDATGAGEPIAVDLYESIYWADVCGFKFTSASKPQLINGLAIAIQNKEIVLLNKDAKVMDEPIGLIALSELGAYQYFKTNSGNLIMSAPAGKHDDCVISIALAWRMVQDFVYGVNPVVVEDSRFSD